ncbi:MAG: hypothetical protein J5809_01940 [Selenomonadaceae bacterium]|nr:hypothetical protein [Selenomonadaceae bacterium]
MRGNSGGGEKIIGEIENFRYRFLDGAVVLFDKIDTAFNSFVDGLHVGRFADRLQKFLDKEV